MIGLRTLTRQKTSRNYYHQTGYLDLYFMGYLNFVLVNCCLNFVFVKVFLSLLIVSNLTIQNEGVFLKCFIITLCY